MFKRTLVVGLMFGIIVATGCSPVQKGTAMGGAAGGATGAAIGHYATSAGGGPGALVGMGLGAATGAIAAEKYYGSKDDGNLDGMTEEVEELHRQLSEKDQALQAREAALAKSEAHQKALLEAYEKARRQPTTLAADVPHMPDNIQVSKEGNSIKYTILSEVLFDSGQAELTDAGKKTLAEAVRLIRNSHPDADIQVRGHTDNVPIRYSPFKSNWDLSCARAVSVVHYLVESEGMHGDRLMAVGCGDTRPVASNDSGEGRRKNRRAELVVRPAAIQVAEVRASE